MLAFSTSWNADGRFTPRALAGLVRGFGLDAIELSYYHTDRDVATLVECCRAMGIRVVSVHNYCPLPADAAHARARSEALLLSSSDEAERARAIEQTRRSIWTAASLGAGVLIVHAGRAEVPSRTGDLIGLYIEGQRGSKRFRVVRDRMVRERALKGRRSFEAALRSIEVLCETATAAGVVMAIENRFYHREIPSLDECREILERFKGAPVGYWHDIGHAQVMENLGFWSHDEWLQVAGDRVHGFHIHDVLLCRDHLPPSSGMVNFGHFRDLRRPDTLLITELSPTHGTAAVAKGIECILSFLRGGTVI